MAVARWEEDDHVGRRRRPAAMAMDAMVFVGFGRRRLMQGVSAQRCTTPRKSKNPSETPFPGSAPS